MKVPCLILQPAYTSHVGAASSFKAVRRPKSYLRLCARTCNAHAAAAHPLEALPLLSGDCAWCRQSGRQLYDDHVQRRLAIWDSGDHLLFWQRLGRSELLAGQSSIQISFLLGSMMLLDLSAVSGQAHAWCATVIIVMHV